jgi:hypothetical protein
VISVSEVQKPASEDYMHSTNTVYFPLDLFGRIVCSLNIISVTINEKPLKMVFDFQLTMKKTFVIGWDSSIPTVVQKWDLRSH